MQQKPVAFFDIDGTLFRSSLLIELVDELILAGLFSSEVTDEYAAQHAAWLARTGTYEAYIGAVIRAFMNHIVGISYGDFAAIGHRVVLEKGGRVYRFTRDYIKQLKSQGYAVIAISQSPKIILDDFCEDFGFDKVYGRMYEVDDTDCFTGVVMDEHLIEDKAKIVARVLERHQDLTLDNSIAVGDTDGDISLLESVTKPICFNPNQALFDHAKKQDWSVVVERKDVVYEL